MALSFLTITLKAYNSVWRVIDHRAGRPHSFVRALGIDESWITEAHQSYNTFDTNTSTPTPSTNAVDFMKTQRQPTISSLRGASEFAVTHFSQ